MLNKILKNKAKLFLVLFFIALLAMVRFFEDYLFYDPFIVYYKKNFNLLPIPNLNLLHLFASYLFRYVLNMIFSLLLLYFVFKDLTVLKFAAFLYGIFFCILIFLFYLLLLKWGETNKMTLFYIRRFLIQPLFLGLFFPAFYLQKKSKQ